MSINPLWLGLLPHPKHTHVVSWYEVKPGQKPIHHQRRFTLDGTRQIDEQAYEIIGRRIRCQVEPVIP